MALFDWEFATLCVMVVFHVLQQSREKRGQREALARTERERGRGAALRLEAEHDLWSNARIKRIATEIERLEGIESADRFRKEVEEARAGTSFLHRPVRARWAIPIMLALTLVVMAVYVLCFG